MRNAAPDASEKSLDISIAIMSRSDNLLITGINSEHTASAAGSSARAGREIMCLFIIPPAGSPAESGIYRENAGIVVAIGYTQLHVLYPIPQKRQLAAPERQFREIVLLGKMAQHQLLST